MKWQDYNNVLVWSVLINQSTFTPLRNKIHHGNQCQCLCKYQQEVSGGKIAEITWWSPNFTPRRCSPARKCDPPPLTSIKAATREPSGGAGTQDAPQVDQSSQGSSHPSSGEEAPSSKESHELRCSILCGIHTPPHTASSPDLGHWPAEWEGNASPETFVRDHPASHCVV